MAASAANPMSVVEHKNMRFIISDAPTDRHVEAYIREYLRNGATDLVRACHGTYDIARVEQAGIHVHELGFPDGAPPPNDVISAWLDLCDERFGAGGAGPAKAPAPPAAAAAGAKVTSDKPAIAVHCVAGLGRAPVLVAIALIEAGLEPNEAVRVVRAKRPSALNKKQLLYLTESYSRRRGGTCCIIA